MDSAIIGRMENATPQQILDKVRSSKNILVNMDTRTDFDALASSIVFGNFLDSIGKTYKIIHAKKIKNTFNGYFEFDKIQTEKDISLTDLDPYDLIIFLDSGSKDHVSLNMSFEFPKNVTTINIDHHATNDMFGDLNYVFQLGSCCTVLSQLFNQVGYTLSVEDMSILTIGILTDTGFLKFDTARSQDYRTIADFIDKGVSVWEINSKLAGSEYFDQIKYKKFVYDKLVVNFDKKYGYVTITFQELDDAGINMENVFVKHVDLIRYIIGLDFVFAVSEAENEPNTYNLSFRTATPGVDVAKIAQIFGGGGNVMAAGGNVYNQKSIEDALAFVLEKLNLT